MADPIRKVVRTGSDQDRLKSKVLIHPQTQCWEWQASLTPMGYGQVRFQGARKLAHRVAWTLFRGEIPENDTAYGTMNVLHRCDNPRCINPDHLFLGDQKLNALDSVSKQRWGRRGCKGETHGRAVVTENIVRQMRASKESVHLLAERFGLSLGAVRHILKRRSWKHVL